MNTEWALVDTYTTEAEARVVESFLRAQGFEIQLLDTHAPYGVGPTQGLASSGGFRLMAHSPDVAEIRSLLLESQKPTHLEVLGEEVPFRRSMSERWIIGLLIFVALVVAILLRY